MSPLRVMLIISSLAGGGAERVIVDLAHFLAERGYSVTVGTLEGDRADHFSLSLAVHRVRTDIMWESGGPLEKIVGTLRRLRMIRRLVVSARPDVVISFIEMTNVRVLVSLIGTGIPVVVSERTDPRHHHVGGVWHFMRRNSYRIAARVVVQTENVAQWARSWLSAKRVVVIPNAVRRISDTPSSCRPSGMPQGRIVLGMGRLSREKGFDLLINAFAQTGLHRDNWSLILLGEGTERLALLAQATALGIAENVHMPGIQSKPGDWLHHTDIFALSSRYEGFPNALLEAMQLGVACVAFDCNSGPAEIIRNDIDGLLLPAEDENALSEALHRLAGNDALRKRLADQARFVSQRFSAQAVYQQWQNVCEDLATQTQCCSK